ncbi:MAG: hypothetical protein JXA10_14705, partial [Anaerolineae bacterium]|nr:hypothetical protein [Anaerolineae bacterium]
MVTHDTHDPDWPGDAWEDAAEVEEADDWRGEWSQDRIADLEDRLYEDADIQYFAASLGERHDDAGYYDDSHEDSRAMYAVAPTRWENFLVRLWWRWLVLPGALLLPLLLLFGGFFLLSMLSDDAADLPVSPASAPDTT